MKISYRLSGASGPGSWRTRSPGCYPEHASGWEYDSARHSVPAAGFDGRRQTRPLAPRSGPELVQNLVVVADGTVVDPFQIRKRQLHSSRTRRPTDDRDQVIGECLRLTHADPL